MLASLAGLLLGTSISVYLALSRPTLRSPLDNVTHQRAEIAINHSLSYLDNPGPKAKISPFQWLIIDYLQRAYQLDKKFSYDARGISPPAEEPDASEFRVYERIVHPNALVRQLPATSNPMSQMMMAAANCDHIPLPDGFGDLMRHNLDAGGYPLTHVAYVLERLKELHCPLHAEDTKYLTTQSAQRIAAMVKNPTTSPDLRYEGMAFLIHMGRRDLVLAASLQEMIREQQPDGSWKRNTSDIRGDDHATTLATWALLEAGRPNVTGEPILRQPGR